MAGGVDIIQYYARELLGKHPILAILLASAPTVGPLLLNLYLQRKKDKQEAEKSDEERSDERAKALDAQQAGLNTENARWFSLLREENTVLRQMVKDREHWLDVARAWYSRSHELLIELRESYYEASLLIKWINNNPSLTNVPPVNMDRFDPDKLPKPPLSIEDIIK